MQCDNVKATEHSEASMITCVGYRSEKSPEWYPRTKESWGITLKMLTTKQVVAFGVKLHLWCALENRDLIFWQYFDFNKVKEL